jgi:polysaccharide deacetylase 2 family uncharacterized protein YibQ
MAKRRSSQKEPRGPMLIGLVVAAALLLFLAGELFAWANSDRGRVQVWRWAHMGDRATIVRLVGKRIEDGLSRAGVAREAIDVSVVEGQAPQVRWKVTLPREGSPLLVNHLVTRAVESGGAQVLSGREAVDGTGALVVTLLVGAPGRPTHELTVTRPGRREDDVREPTRIALVLFASAEDEALLVSACARSETFAVASAATGEGKTKALRAAHASGREVVLLMPMEPENYPRNNPGPATLLVNWSAGRIEQGLRREVEVAQPLVAVANLQGSFATQDEMFMTAVYRELRRAHLPLLHMNPAPRAVCRALASKVGAAYDEPDLVIDGETRRGDAKSLDKFWNASLERLRERRHAIVMLRVNERTAPWLDRALSEKRLEGVQLVPLSTVIRRPTAGH